MVRAEDYEVISQEINPMRLLAVLKRDRSMGVIIDRSDGIVYVDVVIGSAIVRGYWSDYSMTTRNLQKVLDGEIQKYQNINGL